MKDAGEAMAGLARPMQHALNNLIMVMQANMDSVLASLAPDDRAHLRLSRAAQATRDMDALLRAYLRLGREEDQAPLDSGKLMTSLRPLLATGIGRPLTLTTAATASTAAPRPALDLALLHAAQGARALPRTTAPALALDGLRLSMNWALTPEAAEGLGAAGVTVAEAGAESCALLLPE